MRLVCSCLLSFCLLALCSTALAEPRRDQQIATLANLPGVYVDVSLVFPEVKMTTLRRNWILGAVNRILKDRDVPFAGEGEAALDRAAVLLVRAEVEEFRSDEYIYLVTVELWQPVKLQFEPARAQTVTWRTAKQGTFSGYGKNPVPEVINDLAAQFAGDYESTQPMKPKKKRKTQEETAMDRGSPLGEELKAIKPEE